MEPFLRAYGFEKRYQLERLRLTLDKAEEAYRSHQPETIDFCKAALETICKAIVAEKGTGKAGIQDLQELVGSALKAVGCMDKTIQNRIGALAQALAEARNQNTVAGHGLDGAKPLISKAYINLFVSTFAHLVDMLLHLLDAEEVDMTKTKMSFSGLEGQLGLTPLNRTLDASVSVEYVEEDGLVFINGKELRPSEILYYFDREAYLQGIQKAEEQWGERLSDLLTDIITGEVEERFDGFHPGHYGYDLEEVYLGEIKRTVKQITVTGSVSATAQLGSSSDGIGVPYHSLFHAVFSLDEADDPSTDNVVLEELTLKKGDWIEPESDAAE